MEAAHRQRLTQLHVAYGNALIAARGYGAPETTEAFARARESTAGDKDAPGRLSADYGLWVGSFTRGELPSMRAHSADFLSDVQAETRFARGRRRPSRRRNDLLVRAASIARQRIIWNGRSPCSNPAAMTIWRSVSDRTQASPRWRILRLFCGLWARSIARRRSCRGCWRA